MFLTCDPQLIFIVSGISGEALEILVSLRRLRRIVILAIFYGFIEDIRYFPSELSSSD